MNLHPNATLAFVRESRRDEISIEKIAPINFSQPIMGGTGDVAPKGALGSQGRSLGYKYFVPTGLPN